MQSAKGQLFTKSDLQNPGKLLLKSSATHKDNSEVQIEMYFKGFVEISGKGHNEARKSFEFDFDIKFYFTSSPAEVTFEKYDTKLTYCLRSDSLVEEWRHVLRGKLNQRGFHQQFKPIKKIGKGNFASVYLAEKLEDNTSYAVKAFSKEAAYSEDKGKECLIKEIQVMRNLDHKNNMKLHQVFESENSLYIIFELLQGGQLYDKIKAKYKFRPQETQLIIRGILLGLRQCHAKNIMHRDLKPENLLFRKEGDFDCVIADFGLAEFSNISEYLFVRCGTPGYVAPEVINIKDMKMKYSPICDMFSLGLIFHLLMFGKSAFPGTTYNEVLSQNRACNISFNEDDTKKIGVNAMNLLQGMLKKNPLERISAEDAAKHPYFTIETSNIPSQGQLQQKDTVNGIDSPLLTTSNAKRRQDKNVKKDSCVEFKMGKENMMTGKTDTVGTMGSKLSGVDHSQTMKKGKMSQFCAEKR